LVDNSGWTQLNVTYVSGAAPSNNEAIVLSFSQAGDKGAFGNRQIAWMIGDGVNVIAPGLYAGPKTNYAGTLNRWDMESYPSGSATMDVCRANGAIPTSGNSICNGHAPAISSNTMANNTNLSNWSSTAVAVDDRWAVNVTGVTNAKELHLYLDVVPS